jgi:hypothetical protein
MTKTFVCEKCGVEFEPLRDRSHQRFCSQQCRGVKNKSTEEQYRYHGRDPKSYLRWLKTKSDRSKLDLDYLVELWTTQDGRCAITNVKMQHSLSPDSPYNASIDRINAGQPYTNENVHLVIKFVNFWRSDLTIDEFKTLIVNVARHIEGSGA